MGEKATDRAHAELAWPDPFTIAQPLTPKDGDSYPGRVLVYHFILKLQITEKILELVETLHTFSVTTGGRWSIEIRCRRFPAYYFFFTLMWILLRNPIQ